MQSRLSYRLDKLVRDYGLAQVIRELGEIERRTRAHNSAKSAAPPAKKAKRASRKRRPKPTASQYVAKMELSPEKAKFVTELAKRFDTKSFLPSFVGDVVGFCQRYGVQVPASRSRASAVPRVFKRIESLETEEIRRILDERLFSGPSRLGPIADAIRRNGRAAAGRL